MPYERTQKPISTWPALLLIMLIALAAVAAAYRFIYGLGVTTGQSDTWPWGIWKAFNVMGLISLGAAGFVTAALIYFFGGERYHGLARATVLWAILCYGFCGASLVVDISVPWRIVNPIYMWPTQSVLFEVAWCVILYLTVLVLELVPAVFDRFGWERLRDIWKKLIPIYTIIGLSFFTYLMSHQSLLWAVSAFVLFSVLAILLPRVNKNPSTPALIVMFGIILSVNHQSSLGSLFLLMPDKLSHFWWSPRLPFNFLISAAAIGFSLVLVERAISAKFFNCNAYNDQLSRLAGIAMACLWFYFGFRMIDVVIQAIQVSAAGNIATAFGGTKHALLFFIEIVGGVFLPALMFSFPVVRNTPALRVTAATLAVLGGLFNRINVGFLGMTMPGQYIPTITEWLVAIGTIAAIILIYSIGIKLFPIFEVDEEEHSTHVAQPRTNP